MFMLNGFGTTLYGRTKVDNQPGHVATKWFCLLYAPVFPLKSYVVTEETEGPNLLVWESTSYKLTPLDRLFRKHLLYWAAGWSAFILAMILLGWLTNEPT